MQELCTGMQLSAEMAPSAPAMAVAGHGCHAYQAFRGSLDRVATDFVRKTTCPGACVAAPGQAMQ